MPVRREGHVNARASLRLRHAAFHSRALHACLSSSTCSTAQRMGFRKNGPVLEHQRRRHREDPARATWNWRHRISANHGESGGSRYTRDQGLVYAGRNSAPHDPQSSFSAARLIRGFLEHLLLLQPCRSAPQSSCSVTDETNPCVAGRSSKFCASL